MARGGVIRHYAGPNHFVIRHGVIHLTFSPPNMDSSASTTFGVSADHFLFFHLLPINRDPAATTLHMTSSE
jgi:hypothetical protein